MSHMPGPSKGLLPEQANTPARTMQLTFCTSILKVVADRGGMWVLLPPCLRAYIIPLFPRTHL